MLLNLPLELLIKIIDYLRPHQKLSMVLISKKMEEIIRDTSWKISQIIMKKTKNINSLIKFNLCINELILKQGKNKNSFINVNLIQLNYKILNFCCVNFAKINIKDFRNLDLTISDKCDKIKFYNCRGFNKSLINSLKYLKKCKCIMIYGDIKKKNCTFETFKNFA